MLQPSVGAGAARPLLSFLTFPSCSSTIEHMIIQYTIEVEVPDEKQEAVELYAMELLNAVTDLMPTMILAKVSYQNDDGS